MERAGWRGGGRAETYVVPEPLSGSPLCACSAVATLRFSIPSPGGVRPHLLPAPCLNPSPSILTLLPAPLLMLQEGVCGGGGRDGEGGGKRGGGVERGLNVSCRRWGGRVGREPCPCVFPAPSSRKAPGPQPGLGPLPTPSCLPLGGSPSWLLCCKSGEEGAPILVSL